MDVLAALKAERERCNAALEEIRRRQRVDLTSDGMSTHAPAPASSVGGSDGAHDPTARKLFAEADKATPAKVDMLPEAVTPPPTEKKDESGAKEAEAEKPEAEKAAEEPPKKPLPSAATDMFAEYQSLLQQAGMFENGNPGENYGDEALPSIGPNDVLLVIDMQNDFIPESAAPNGGKFGVADGENIAMDIVRLINHFSDSGATIIATRDYHPVDHCSFNTKGGPFPPHCIQGSPGSYFFPPIGAALASARKGNENRVRIVFKGFSEDVDSFGGFPYPQEYAEGRVTCTGSEGPGCHLQWTGCYELKMSNIDEDINAPPDILSVLKKTSITEMINGFADPQVAFSTKRLFVVGLALDFCNLDTSLNAASQGYKNVYLVLDAGRSAHIPGVGQFGSGYLTNPKEMVEKMSAKGVKGIRTNQLFG